MESNGLGDSIAKVTHALRLDKVADAVARLVGIEGCGCNERKEYLNQLFPYQNYRRTFRVITGFYDNDTYYPPDQEIVITKSSPLFQSVIQFVEYGLIEEI